eukprot:450784-Prymnesium_polylepis.1
MPRVASVHAAARGCRADSERVHALAGSGAHLGRAVEGVRLGDHAQVLAVDRLHRVVHLLARLLGAGEADADHLRLHLAEPDRRLCRRVGLQAREEQLH